MFSLINFNFFVLKKCPDKKIRTKGKIIANPPKFLVKAIFTLSSILPSDTPKKFLRYAIKKTIAVQIIRNPNILKTVCLLILNFKKGIFNNDFLLAIVFHCILNFFQIQPRLLFSHTLRVCLLYLLYTHTLRVCRLKT